MKRLAATLAGLALVLLPSAIAMSSADTSATSRPAMSPSYMQYLNSAPSSQGHHRGRHCHRDKNKSQQQSTGEPDV